LDDKLKKYLGAGLSEDELSFTARFARPVRSGNEEVSSITITEPMIGQIEEAAKIDSRLGMLRRLMSLCGSRTDGGNPISPEALKQLPVSEFRKAERFIENFTAAGPETGASI